VIDYDADAAKKAAAAALKAGIKPDEAVDKGLAVGVRVVGDAFERGECFLPHVVIAADVMTEAMNVLMQGLSKEEAAKLSKGTIVMATVEGDLHDLGKNIVIAMLRASGFTVHDLGKDVNTETIVNRAQELNADVIGLSSLMTTTRPYMRVLIEELERLKLRDQFKVMVGGGPISREWAEEIQADGYGYNASEAVTEALKLIGGS
jgi:corrinoid protein of di/trimethylamine methyltransferase